MAAPASVKRTLGPRATVTLAAAATIVASAAVVGTPIRRETRSALSPEMIVPTAMRWREAPPWSR
jgi:hypothetical protein